jgi:salicylate hydroxylase
MPSATHPTLRVAIVGGGPGGLAAAISLSKLPSVNVTIYEQARELREIGAGINIGFNCWKVLEVLGADGDVNGHVHTNVEHRYIFPSRSL